MLADNVCSCFSDHFPVCFSAVKNQLGLSYVFVTFESSRCGICSIDQRSWVQFLFEADCNLLCNAGLSVIDLLPQNLFLQFKFEYVWIIFFPKSNTFESFFFQIKYVWNKKKVYPNVFDFEKKPNYILREQSSWNISHFSVCFSAVEKVNLVWVRFLFGFC